MRTIKVLLCIALGLCVWQLIANNFPAQETLDVGFALLLLAGVAMVAKANERGWKVGTMVILCGVLGLMAVHVVPPPS